MRYVTLVVLVVAASACRAAPSQESTRAAIVQFSPLADDRAVREIRESAGAEVIAVLPRTGAQLWRISPDRVAALRLLVADSRVALLEVAPQAAPSALPPDSVGVEALPAGDRAFVQRLTRGLEPEDFRITTARSQALTADVLEAGGAQPFSLPLVPGVTPSVRRERLNPEPNGDFSWIGRMADGTGEVLLVVRQRGITGHVRMGAQVFSVRPLGQGRQLVKREEVDQSAPDHPPEAPSGALPQASAVPAPPPACTPVDETVDVLVVYAKLAAKELSHNEDLAAFAQLAVDHTNDSFVRSKIGIMLHRIGTSVVDFDESENIAADVEAMVAGRVKGLFTLRDAVKADLVVMIVAHPMGHGHAGAIYADAKTAFAATSYGFAVSYSQFAHEVGHLFGARHDRDDDSEDTPFKYGHGYALKGEWRTIMAQPGDCKCRREAMWADSTLTFPDSKGIPQPTGNKDLAEDARVIRETGPILAQFRCRAPQDGS